MMNFGLAEIAILIMVLFWLLVIFGAILLVVALVRRSSRQSGQGPLAPGAPAGQTPLDVLNMRYAKGELTKAQYDEMRRDLGI